MGCIFLLLCMPGNFYLDVNSHEFFLFGHWIFVCLFSLFYLGWKMKSLFVLWEATSGEVSEEAYLDIGTSYQMAASELVWGGLPMCPEFIPQCWRVACSFPEHSLSVRLHCQYCTFTSFFFLHKKERNLNYWSPPELRAGAIATLLHQMCFTPFLFHSSVHL